MIKYALIFLLFILITFSLKAQYSFSVLELENNSLSKKLSYWSGGVHGSLFFSFDLDQNEELDLLAYDRNSNRIRSYISERGKFEYSPEFEENFPKDIANWVLIKDLDLDGIPELLTNGERGIKVFELNRGEADFSWDKIADPLYYTLESNSKEINLLIPSGDVPAVVDVDEDGDLDILFYNNNSSFISLFENKGSSGSSAYAFELTNPRWGNVQECDCGNFGFGEELCVHHITRVLHKGGKSLTIEDFDEDGDLDIITGQENCQQLYYLENKGSSKQAKFTDSQEILSENEFLAYPVASLLSIKGNKKLILGNHSTSTKEPTEFKSYNVESEKQFSLQINREGLFKQEVFDLGSWTAPMFYDLDADADLDLLVAYKPKKSKSDDSTYARIAYYENVGNKWSPRFRLKNEDYLNLSKKKWFYIQPSLINFRNQDNLLLNVFNLQEARPALFYKEFSKIESDKFPFESLEIPNLQFGDQLLVEESRLFLAKSYGRLDLYENIEKGSKSLNFRLKKSDIISRNQVKNQSNLSLINLEKDIYLVMNSDGITKKMRLDQDMPLFEEFVIEKDNEVLDYRFSSTNFLSKASLYEGKRETLVMGGLEGGLWVLDSKEKNEKVQTLYPNPVKTYLYLEEREEGASVKIYDLHTRLVMSKKDFPSTGLDVSKLNQGIYILHYLSKQENRYFKFIKQD